MRDAGAALAALLGETFSFPDPFIPLGWQGLQQPVLKRWYEPKIEEKVLERDTQGKPTKVARYALFDDRAYRMDKSGWRRLEAEPKV